MGDEWEDGRGLKGGCQEINHVLMPYILSAPRTIANYSLSPYLPLLLFPSFLLSQLPPPHTHVQPLKTSLAGGMLYQRFRLPVPAPRPGYMHYFLGTSASTYIYVHTWFKLGHSTHPPQDFGLGAVRRCTSLRLYGRMGASCHWAG